MKREPGTAVYDSGLRLEAYCFRRSFPEHFHEHYVVGFVEQGQGILLCRGVEYALKRGDVVIYNPGDSHSWAESGAALDYRGFHIPRETMLDLTGETEGDPPRFSQNVVCDEACVQGLRTLHDQVMRGVQSSGREEELRRLLARLLRLCGGRPGPSAPGKAVERACAFMREHCAEHVSLDQLSGLAGLSKSALLRAFARETGVTPYRYLESIRISAAKKLLEQGVPPAEAALQTGFSDQSHFTNCFSRYIGLAPGAYREIFLDKEGDVS